MCVSPPTVPMPPTPPADEVEARGALVLGVGNVLMSDEGIGVLAAEALLERVPIGVRVLTGGAIGQALLPEVEVADRLLVLDCIDAGREPGTVIRIEGRDLPSRTRPVVSPHELSVGDLIAMAELHGGAPAEIVVLGIQPGLVAPGMEPSPQVAAALPRLVEAALEVLEGWTGQGRTLPRGGAQRPGPDL
ncbi:MAG TPA: HyaD/HybD family hydrogenase maturation endopeptidase [Actinomycetota bacterium]|nr:HyaD/HybD family hydrogenase maturation endopeptidase [Actinomycetota bacterium]